MSKKHRKSPYLAGHQRSWIWGRHAVSETLEAGNWPILELYLGEEMPAEERALALQKAAQRGVAATTVSYERLRELCGASDHQGHLARMGPFPYAAVDELLDGHPESPLYVLLDGVRDAHNFGAILRSAAALGVTAVFCGGPGQTPINNHTVRASAGAVNRIPVATVDTLLPVMDALQEHGVRCIAADHRANTPAWECDFKPASALLLGNEAQGIQHELRERCDAAVMIPVSRGLDSLNVSAAAAALLYEALRQRSG